MDLIEEGSMTMLHNKSLAPVSRLAIDIGGSLIKLVYFSSDGDPSISEDPNWYSNVSLGLSNGEKDQSGFEGRLYFAKFETRKINDCLEFIQSRRLHIDSGSSQPKGPCGENIIVKATGGGAYKFTDLFMEKLGISIDKEDEMDCLVAGSNFLLKNVQSGIDDCRIKCHDHVPVPHRIPVVHQEAFTYIDGQKDFVQIDHNDLYPYLLVNIGSGVSMIKVDGDGKFERVSGTSVGGGTFWGLGRLLTKCKSFDELLELSHKGNNRVIDMLVGDIYGGMDYSKIGLTSTAIASSFGKAIADKKELEDYKPEDVSRSLLRMISNNVGQISYLNALRYGLKRIFFGGFFIRGHEYTMDTISVAVHFWSKGEAKAMFLQHEGFLGALGAYMCYEKHEVVNLTVHQFGQQYPVSGSNPEDKLHRSLTSNLYEGENIDCHVCTS